VTRRRDAARDIDRGGASLLWGGDTPLGVGIRDPLRGSDLPCRIQRRQSRPELIDHPDHTQSLCHRTRLGIDQGIPHHDRGLDRHEHTGEDRRHHLTRHTIPTQ